MPRSPSHRRIARYVLGALVLVHAGGFLIYERYTHQLAERQLAVDARDEWREGHLEAAAAGYRQFIADYASVTRPFVLVKAMPSEASAWFALGRVETDRHRVDAALAAFAEAMQQEPGLGRREYRDLLFEAGRYQDLEAFARRTLEAEPHSLAGVFDLGAALYAQGRTASAALAYERGLSYVPEYLASTDPGFHGSVSVPEAELLNLASVSHLAAGDHERAQAACEGLTARLPKTAHLDRLCRAFLEAGAGRLDSSREILKGYIPARPEEEALVTALNARLEATPAKP